MEYLKDMNTKTIGVVTSTRAEYGLLKNVMSYIKNDEDLKLVLFVTGTHLCKEYGYTLKEIEDDGFVADEKIDILSQKDDFMGICETIANASTLFAEAFTRKHIDFLVVLGDRYELLPICQVAMNACIPIAHISGGESTEGAVDEAIRHCITKMSYLHFPGCELYRKRIIQLGEDPGRVFNFGDVGVENVLSLKCLSKEELEKSIGTTLDKPYFSVTFHPVTLETGMAGTQMSELLEAISSFPQYKFIFTKANADRDNKIVNKMIDDFVLENDNCEAYESLGLLRYLSLLKHSVGVIGNSSSGIVEAPIYKIPTINIGNRQSGRLKAKSIIDCIPKKSDIVDAILLSQKNEFINLNCDGSSPYAGGNTSYEIVRKIKEVLFKGNIDLKKKFYDVEF